MNLISIFHDNEVKDYPYYTLDVIIKILTKVNQFLSFLIIKIKRNIVFPKFIKFRKIIHKFHHESI